EEYLPLTPMRKAIAEHMVRSVQTAPHATAVVEVDMTPLVRWREANKEAARARYGVDITYVAFVIHAVVGALKAVPIMNSSWGEDRIILKRPMNALVKRPVVVDDAIAIRAMMNLCLSFDHRIIDGLIAGRFLERVVENIHALDPSNL